MTNAEKYKNVRERQNAFSSFCHLDCTYCPCADHGCDENPTDGAFIWLELEAEPDSPVIKIQGLLSDIREIIADSDLDTEEGRCDMMSSVRKKIETIEHCLEKLKEKTCEDEIDD